MEFGEKLKELREAKGYGVNQLAMKSGVSSSQISRFENGSRKDPTLETVKKLSKALNVSISYFEDEPDATQTVAAHIDDDIDEDEMKEILNFIDYIKNRDKK
ncbi:helix-turn-helix domain-containing protein [Enterococcus dongliensis]|uniref:helix-turn-helix domain-containing protein n=1 Tax=Enterococcus dongliensis TaxID=2559925 RepID=UPI00289167AA|nr:helix-turn-helix transcriptional regulator [Enterococcus dongliensis]MDT2703665.1 helix-turn-helix transcriptional regulator [Enterococcus dongliensis]